MRKLAFALLAAAASAALIVAYASRGGSPSAAQASSHREAPLISEDPSADNTDTYAFRSPDKPDTVSIIANYIPGEDPAAGPNWYTFSPSARYVVYADKNGDGKPDVTWRFRFKNRAPVAFLQNTQQEYTVTRVDGKSSRVVGSGSADAARQHRAAVDAELPLAGMAGVHDLNDRSKVFAGQRDDGFFGDIGAIFDLVAIREGTGATGGGKDFFAGYAVHSIALQVPLSQLDNGGNHVVGIWAASERPEITVEGEVRTAGKRTTANWVQVSRLGNPLINEVLIPTELKDKWNASTPDKDKQFEQYYSTPILAHLLNQLYPQFGPFQETNRSDLVSVLLTGLKEPNLNFTGTTQADELRLNLGIAPTAPFVKGNRLGVLGGDLAGWPERPAAGRRRHRHR